MDSSPTQTPREKLEAWLRYYDDLNLGAFYTDRRTMGKRPIKTSGGEVRLPRRLPCSRRLPVAPPKAAPPVSVLPIVNAPSLFEALDRVEGDTLERIREDLGECTRCRLHKQRNKIVFGAGNPRAELVFVGEGPGHDEDVQGLPFVGRAGKLLTQMIEAMGLTREAGLHLQRREMPAAGKPQARGRRGRDLLALFVPPAGRDRAEGDRLPRRNRRAGALENQGFHFAISRQLV